MPFLSQKRNPPTRVAKAEVVNAELAAELDRLSRVYREAINNLYGIVSTAQNAVSGGSLEEFRILLSDDVVRSLQESLRTAESATARQALRDGARAVSQLPRGLGVGMSFDGKDPRAIAWARQRAGSLISQVTTEQLEMIRVYIGESLANGIPLSATAQRIERVIGLHDRWQRAVANAFERDREAFISQGMSVDAATKKATKAAEKYRTRLIRARAKNIARTELAAAQNYGTYLSWVQAADKGLINMSITKKEWVAGPSGWKGITVCDICAPLNGVQVPMNASFPNGVLMPPAHPSCRCRAILIPPEVL